MKRLSIFFSSLLCVAVLLGSAACTTAPVSSGAPPLTAEQQAAAQLAEAQRTVFNLQSAYNAALITMIAYKKLPVCGSPGATKICHTTEAVKQLQDADRIAFESLMAAQDIVRAPGAGLNIPTVLAAASRAMQALVSLTAALPKP